MQENENIVENDNQVYEVGHLFVPTLSEEAVPVAFTELKELIKSLGGEIIAEDMPKMIPLAYSMLKVVENVRSKVDTAYFGWIKFAMTGEAVGTLKKKLDMRTDIVRFLITKTVRENTLATKRFVSREGGLRRKPTYTKKEEKTEDAPINKEELDKEIEAMVVE